MNRLVGGWVNRWVGTALGKAGWVPPTLCSMPAQQAIAAGCQVHATQLPPSCPPPCPQLSYIHRLFDVEGLLHSLESPEAREAAEQKLEPIR